jgi:drug/metabolite transporter (DMT)-like permease
MLNYWVLFGKKPEKNMTLGAILGVGGIVIVFWHEFLHIDRSNVGLGLALCLAATYAASWGNIVAKKVSKLGLPIIQSNGLAMFFSGCFSFVVAYVLGAEIKTQFSFEFWGALVYLAVFGSVIGFGAYMILLRNIGAEKAAYITVLFPIVALTISTYLEDFHWSLDTVVGIVLILLGNVVAFRKEKTS